MGTKMAVAFANIFMAKTEQAILKLYTKNPLAWKRFIDYIFCLLDINKEDIEHFIDQANAYHPTIKFTAKISEKETTFLDTTVYKGEKFEKEGILDVRTHFKPTETSQYTHFKSCHPKLSKEKLSDFLEQILKKILLKRTLSIWKRALSREATRNKW